jgi:hypothetical protein
MLTENTTTHFNLEDEPTMTNFIVKKLPYDLSSLLFDSSPRKTYQIYNKINCLEMIF